MDIQHITNIQHSVITGDVNAHSTLCHSYTDNNIRQIIADVISNLDHITLNTDTPTKYCAHLHHISSSKDIRSRLTRHTVAQLRTNKSPFLKSYLHKVEAKSHPSPLCTLCNTHTHNISSTAPTYALRCRPWICGQTPQE